MEFSGPAKDSIAITNGIADILSGEDLSQNSTVNSDLGLNKRYMIFNIISFVILLLLAWHVIRTKTFIKRINKSKRALVSNILFSFVIDIIAPLGLLGYFMFRVLAGSDLELNIISIRYCLIQLMTGFFTDYVYIALVAILLLLICGITKAVIVINKIRK